MLFVITAVLHMNKCHLDIPQNALFEVLDTMAKYCIISNMCQANM